jgi:DNA gyrase inhibitor GyrI
MDPLQHRSYGIHLTDPRTTLINVHRDDFCVLVDFEVEPNALGI